MEYVFKSLEINQFINELTIKDYIAPLMNHYYPPEITLVQLIRNYRTGVVKKPKYFETNLADIEKKRQIFICFNYKSIRTFGTFIREIRSETSYEMTGLGRLKL